MAAVAARWAHEVVNVTWILVLVVGVVGFETLALVPAAYREDEAAGDGPRRRRSRRTGAVTLLLCGVTLGCAPRWYTRTAVTVAIVVSVSRLVGRHTGPDPAGGLPPPGGGLDDRRRLALASALLVTLHLCTAVGLAPGRRGCAPAAG